MSIFLGGDHSIEWHVGLTAKGGAVATIEWEDHNPPTYKPED